jgi:regulator of protease activity HflC (stomatin/prohibitin superfamily)
MFGIGHFKGQPTDYIIRFSGGTLKQAGRGISFYYLRYNTQIVAVPTSSTDANFVFKEITSNYQEVVIQGQLTYRIADPQKAADLLNLRIDPETSKYVTEDLKVLAQRIVNLVQIEARADVEKRSLEQSMRDAQTIAADVARRLREGTALQSFGVELLSVYFLSVRPTPEMSKALEAEYREALLRKADEAIYARRAAAVDEERTIKEKELGSDVALEHQRKELIVLQGNNALQEAENRGVALEREAQSRAKASEVELAVLRALDPRTLLAIALREMGQNAGRVGNLTITTEMLSSLLNGASAPDGR